MTVLPRIKDFTQAPTPDMRTTTFLASMLVAFASLAMAAPQTTATCDCSNPPALRPRDIICHCPYEPVTTSTTATCDCSSTASLRARQQCNCPIQTL
ncbi:hypothetical protein NEOLEDRAFT_1143192 [Neolentinus lepideus HHB14362 ss-1]|uniref:Extracellular membrane protein CFEM domain-containing protein n=1 Tax=Neolentinus lepideus HHB14362 ss-1 TaxID=1314782 RepID=A0A165MPF4_9AGAM|nr:hypothetical protein NEOLEDRAFT_1143192 [Neolentinus lepideus HHB14362 ss-1]